MSGCGGQGTETLASRRAALLGVVLAALAPPIGGCTGDRIVIGGQRPPSVSELSDPDAGSGRDGGTSPGGIGTPARCPESPGERRQVLGCWPTRQVGRWQGFWLGVPRYETAAGAAIEFPPGDIELRFGVDGGGTFSVGTAPGAAAACAPAADAGACARVGELRAGFGYRLEQVRLEDAGERGTPRVAGDSPPRAGELMQFQLRLGEPWDPWCASASASECRGAVCLAAQTAHESLPAPDAVTLGEDGVSCRCVADRCVAEAAALALSLSMSADGRALRGAYVPGDARWPPVSLELFRVGDP
jgi:hypothetical protein